MSTRAFRIDDLRPWIEQRFDPASGPGGQNVNRVATRATLLFDFQACPLLSAAEKARISQRCASRLDSDDRLRIVAQDARTQAANRRLAETRLLETLAAAVRVPRKRKPTRPTAASKRRRLRRKKERGEIKKLRQTRPRSGE